MTFALQYAIVACLAGWGGSLADAEERKSPSWGHGRLKVLGSFLTLGTAAFLGHGIPQYMNGAFPGELELIWHVLMRAIYAVSMGVVAPTTDGIALAHLDAADGSSTSDFGKERCIGALSWGLGSLVAGVGIDHYGFDFLYAFLIISTISSYISIWVYSLGLSRDTTGVFKTYSVSIIDAEVKDYQNEETKHKDEIIPNFELFSMVCKTNYAKGEISRSLYTCLLTQKENVLTKGHHNVPRRQAFLFFSFTLAMGIAVVDNLAFIFFDSLGASDTMDGLTVVFTVLVEVPAFSLSPFLLERFGPGTMLLAAGFAYVFRVIGYTLVPFGKMYIVLMLETLHGISYAGSKAGGVEFVARMIPDGHEASGQGIYITVTYFGIVAGLLLAGWIQETLGARTMFRVMALIVSIGIIVLLLAELVCEKDTEKSGTKKDESGGDHRLITKSDSCASSGSAFADYSTERFMSSLKYDSLGKNKWVKDW